MEKLDCPTEDTKKQDRGKIYHKEKKRKATLVVVTHLALIKEKRLTISPT
jgi:hypothetical protein